MAENATLARPYARAAFEHALNGNQLAAWGTFLSGAKAAVSDERVSRLIGHPHVKAADLVALIAEVSGASADEAAKNFLQLLASNGRVDLLPEIADQFELLRAEKENTVDVELVSAVALSAEQQQKFQAALAKRLQRSVRLHLAIDPSLLGGAVVRAGDFVIDGSLKGRVERLGTAIAG
jgi:F-type H+-transporting ATPase subunit delta